MAWGSLVDFFFCCSSFRERFTQIHREVREISKFSTQFDSLDLAPDSTRLQKLAHRPWILSKKDLPHILSYPSCSHYFLVWTDQIAPTQMRRRSWRVGPTCQGLLQPPVALAFFHIRQCPPCHCCSCSCGVCSCCGWIGWPLDAVAAAGRRSRPRGGRGWPRSHPFWRGGVEIAPDQGRWRTSGGARVRASRLLRGIKNGRHHNAHMGSSSFFPVATGSSFWMDKVRANLIPSLK
jgi:hypothetical protein